MYARTATAPSTSARTAAGKPPETSSPPEAFVVTAQGSLAAYLTYWLENVAVHHLRETTHTRYTAVVAQYLIPGLGRKKLAKLSAKDVRTWLNELRTVCQCCARGIDAGRDPQAQASRRTRCCALGKCCRRRLSPLTLAYIHSVLKSALEHAVREEEIPRNVARNVRTGTPRPRRFNPLTTDEARQLLAATQGHRLAVLFELALRTGLRKGELLGLHWEDLDLGAGTASIRRTLQRTRSNGLTGLPTKTISSERRIALPATCVTSLRAHRQQQAREKEQAGSAWQDSGYVFTRPDGHPIEPATLTRHFNALLREAHLRPIRFHDLRHSTATLLLEQGVELVVIKELLGHAHIGVTATVYAHIRLRLQRQAIDLLGHALATSAGPRPSPTTATIHRLVQHSSADVAVNYCRQALAQHATAAPPEEIPAGPLPIPDPSDQGITASACGS